MECTLKTASLENFFEHDHLQLVHSGGLACVPDPRHRLVRVGLDPGGVHDLRMDGGLPPGFQKGTLF